MLSTFFSPRLTHQCLLSTRSLLHPTLRKLIPVAATTQTIRNINNSAHKSNIDSGSIISNYDFGRRGTRGSKQAYSRRKWTPEEDERLMKLYKEHGPSYSFLASHFTNRTPSAIYCRSKILFNSKNSEIKVGPWESEELEALRRLTMDIPEGRINWHAIQQQLPQPRNISIIKQTWYHSINPKWNHGRWTKHETSQLEKFIQDFGDQNWCKVSDMLGSRSPRQCLEKYRYQLKPVVKGPFTASEDAAILAAVKKHGTGDFLLIKQVTNSQRTPRQISQHYRYSLDPAFDRSPWSMEEKMELYRLVQTMGTSNMVKIRERMNSRRHGKDMRNQYTLMQQLLSKQGYTPTSTDTGSSNKALDPKPKGEKISI